MKSIKTMWMSGMLTLGIAASAFAMGHEIANTDNFTMNIGGRIQEVAYGQLVHDPVPSKDNARVYLFLKQARLNINGQVEGIKYNTEWVGAAEDINGSNNGLTLLDFWFDVPVYKTQSTWFRVGQFKVPYGRESLNDEAQFQMVDTSIDYKSFNLGRDVGAALHSYFGKFGGTAGVFTGGARDVPLRFLPEHLGVPMFVGRVGYNDGLDKDVYTVAQNDLHPVRFVKATHINGMYMKDTRIGHSTVLNTRTSEKTFMLNTNWNPYLARTPYDRGSFWQGGWDGAMRGPIGKDSAWTAEAQADYSSYSNKYGALRTWGLRTQAGVLKGKFEAALRYALLIPDNNFTNGGVKITGTEKMQEVTPAFSYYMRGHDHKVVLDFPILINVPVFIENAAGLYVSTEQPDQASVIKPATGGVARQTVPEARIMYQLAF